MTRIDLRLEKPKSRVLAMGSGFIALDVIEGEREEFCATGGTCGNVLTILAWLGWQSSPIGRLGKDAAGKFVVKEMAEAGVDTSFLRQDPSTPTPIVIQRNIIDKSGHRTHRFALTCPGCGNWLPRFRPIVRQDAEQAKSAAPTTPSVFFFDRVSSGIIELARWARNAGAVVMFEPANYSDEKHFREAIELCHVLKFSRERLGHVKDFSNTPYPAIIIETQGEEGLRIRWREQWSQMEAFKVSRFVDAAGAGDWCSAGFLHVVSQRGAAGLLSGSKASVERAVRLGQALSAVNCGYEGARGLMMALTQQSTSKLLRSLIGGKGEIPDPREMESKPHKRVPLCELCKPKAGTKGKASKKQRAAS